ncbi:hypothetical protein FFH21_014835 [Pseudomonas sp. KBS0707]|nr:hypothetical protein [Pseudomonas savastanoi pv. phaseolicola]QDW00973.1 hypothetical protein FFH21_014810 [Pseudomonas sp. KBS0707]RMV61453.1 hypothetical protein ALP07_03557 [Pseudomonas savastanoi pv. glycinea]MBN4181763.1 hypothetical protein [Pseudomonas savastanoi pv. phaseolicola]MBN4181768.1 hypothetical protein [Pseudomonas savastanoi pv. phaseolicola]
MDKFSYQQLRYAVESELDNFNSGNADDTAFVNSLMRLFLQAASTEQVKSQIAKRQFLTFRRAPNLIPPSWAYRNPSLSSRLPTL